MSSSYANIIVSLNRLEVVREVVRKDYPTVLRLKGFSSYQNALNKCELVLDSIEKQRRSVDHGKSQELELENKVTVEQSIS